MCLRVFSALKMIFQVQVKRMLALECALVCIVLAPAMSLAFNGMHPHDMFFGLTRGRHRYVCAVQTHTHTHTHTRLLYSSRTCIIVIAPPSLQGLHWSIMPWVGLGHWVVAYPRRHHAWQVALAGALGTACCLPYTISYMCGGSIFMFLFDMVLGSGWRVDRWRWDQCSHNVTNDLRRFGSVWFIGTVSQRRTRRGVQG